MLLGLPMNVAQPSDLVKLISGARVFIGAELRFPWFVYRPPA